MGSEPLSRCVSLQPDVLLEVLFHLYPRFNRKFPRLRLHRWNYSPDFCASLAHFRLTLL
jgi:hypothetical protein